MKEKSIHIVDKWGYPFEKTKRCAFFKRNQIHMPTN